VWILLSEVSVNVDARKPPGKWLFAQPTPAVRGRQQALLFRELFQMINEGEEGTASQIAAIGLRLHSGIVVGWSHRPGKLEGTQSSGENRRRAGRLTAATFHFSAPPFIAQDAGILQRREGFARQRSQTSSGRRIGFATR